ncbi:MAG: hypothetical protein MUQ30_11120 [Anaerolineae bacterium]|nr:hypothetical protein [Anaerolineae bacterium]
MAVASVVVPEAMSVTRGACAGAATCGIRCTGPLGVPEAGAVAAVVGSVADGVSPVALASSGGGSTSVDAGA